MSQMMDNKDKALQILAALLLIMIGIVVFQRTKYEDEVKSLRHQMITDKITIKRLENETNR
jgi:ABC-type nickel/cobalt efflux system permease component RcnA